MSKSDDNKKPSLNNLSFFDLSDEQEGIEKVGEEKDLVGNLEAVAGEDVEARMARKIGF